MIFRKFQVIILSYLLLLLAGTFGVVYFSYIEVNYIRLFFLVLYELLILWAMISYINKTNRDTTYFLNAILHNDFTVKYSATHKGQTYQELYTAFNQVNQKFIDSTQSEASEYQYIVSLIEQMEVGVIIYDELQRIHLANRAVKELLQKQELINLDNIKSINSDLYQAITSLRSKEKRVIKTEISHVIHQFSLVNSKLRVRGKEYSIVSIHDIKNELDKNEMHAWQKLIRVLTHEIMNSVSPITSLSGTLKSVVQDKSVLETAEIGMLNEGLDAIENRSRGLLAFTEAYRSLTKIPLPKMNRIEGNSFFENISSIFKANLSQQIAFQLIIPNTPFHFSADQHLLEQVIINLLKNASEAITQQGNIKLRFATDADAHIISVQDDGPGIPEELRDKVFIPFYTTKVNGSGIGLSLSRQIIQLHQGELSFETSEKGTTFKIVL